MLSGWQFAQLEEHFFSFLDTQVLHECIRDITHISSITRELEDAAVAYVVWVLDRTDLECKRGEHSVFTKYSQQSRKDRFSKNDFITVVCADRITFMIR